MATYEMLWDCPRCDSQKLLGKSHRHCPNCGAAQDPSKRYFPAEEDKVAVEDHVNVGVDWACIACDTPNAKATEFCVNCGSPHDGSAKSVATVASADAIPDVASDADAAAEESSGSGCAILGMGCIPMFFLALFGGIFLMFAFFCIGAFWTSDTRLTVVSQTWERSIEIETLRETTESEWCKQMPSEATDIQRTKKKKSTKKVKDGETCKKVNVDNGDGTMKQVQKCTTKFRDEPVMADHCRYKRKKWKRTETLEKKGNFGTKPEWPASQNKTCNELGCRRNGKRTQLYKVGFQDADKQPQTCDFKEQRWREFTQGSMWTGPKSVLTHQVACADLKRAK